MDASPLVRSASFTTELITLCRVVPFPTDFLEGHSPMTERTTSRWVSFAHPACIEGIDEPLPAGKYLVETDEDQIPGLSFVAYRRLRTLIVVPVGTTTARQLVEVDPKALQTALLHDASLA